MNECIDWLIDCFSFCSMTFHSCRSVTITLEGLLNVDQCPTIMDIEQEGIFNCPFKLPAFTRDNGLYGLIWRTISPWVLRTNSNPDHVKQPNADNYMHVKPIITDKTLTVSGCGVTCEITFLSSVYYCIGVYIITLGVPMLITLYLSF